MLQSNHGFLLTQLVLRDFKIRYRNMSLGVFWSLANPLIMMVVLTFVFTRIHLGVRQKDFHLFVLCGLVVFNFFSLGWSTATVSLLTNSGLIKRVPMAREIIPISTVLANGLHFLIQVALLLALVLIGGYKVTLLWLWLPVIFLLEAVFICGLSLITAALDVYFRDVRYLVDSANMLLFWMVPIVYGQEMIAPQYAWLYAFNPVAAVVLMLRTILFEDALRLQTVVNMASVTIVTALAGVFFFRAMKKRFADYL